MCDNVMSAARARCPDCLEVFQVPYNWCSNPEFRGHPDERLAQDILMRHAEQMPILHPTLLPEHHLMRRPA
jgi:hypothetical protein